MEKALQNGITVDDINEFIDSDRDIYDDIRYEKKFNDLINKYLGYNKLVKSI